MSTLEGLRMMATHYYFEAPDRTRYRRVEWPIGAEPTWMFSTDLGPWRTLSEEKARELERHFTRLGEEGSDHA